MEIIADLDWNRMLRPELLGGLIPLAGMLVGGIAIVTGGICKIVKQKHRHVERLAMIEQGMNPDHLPPSQTAPSDPRATTGS